MGVTILFRRALRLYSTFGQMALHPTLTCPAEKQQPLPPAHQGAPRPAHVDSVVARMTCHSSMINIAGPVGAGQCFEHSLVSIAWFSTPGIFQDFFKGNTAPPTLTCPAQKQQPLLPALQGAPHPAHETHHC
jgi:hypothetical protein